MRALLVRSGNRCAFPGCAHSVVNQKNQFIAEVCHIRAAAPGGERYDAAMRPEERRAGENLLILCHAHHVETDEVAVFTTERLRSMKEDHESQFSCSGFSPPARLASDLAEGLEEYWNAVEQASSDHILPDRAIPIDAEATADTIVGRIAAGHQRVEELFDRWNASASRLGEDVVWLVERCGGSTSAFHAIPYYENRVSNRDWEDRALTATNVMRVLGVHLAQLEVLVLARELLHRPLDRKTRRRLDAAKERLLSMAKYTAIAD